MDTAAEVAVALRYDPAHGGLPQVTARGPGAVAAQILALAAEHGIPVRRDAELVQVLAALDVGRPIPAAAFAAVAEILAYLYRLDKEAGGDGRETA
jgi:flagellar biosynthesis protein